MISTLDTPRRTAARPPGGRVPTDLGWAVCVMPGVRSSVPVFRSFACRMIRHWNLSEVADAVALVVSELVTNAVCHSGSTDVVLRLSGAGDRLTVQVRDFGGWRVPKATAAREQACSGRGLDLVAAFAGAVRIDATDGGTQVTADIRLPTGA